MYSYTRRGPGKGTALLAVLQAILLLSAVVLTPAAVIAQETEPEASQAPAAETTGEPAAEATAEPEAEPRPKAQPDRQRPRVTEPKAEPAPKAAVEPTLGEQGLTIRFFPQKVKVALGGKVVVGAYLCDRNDKTPFGGAKGSGDPTDYCDPVRVKWTVDGPGATTSNTFGKKTKLTLLDDGAPVRLIATVDDLKRPTRIIVKQKAATKRPEALSPKQIEQARAAQPPTAPSDTDTPPTAEPPTAEEPGETPTAKPECLEDPVTGECLAELTDRPFERTPERPTAAPTAEPTAEPTEEPSAEPTEEPSAEPTEEPSDDRHPDVDDGGEPTEEPADEPTEEPSAEPTEEPSAEPTEEPSAEPTEEPTEVPAEDEAGDCLVDPVTGECLVELTERTSERTPERPTDAEPTEAPAEQTAEPKAQPKAEPKEPTFQSSFSVAANVPVLVEARMDSGTDDCIRYDPQDGSNSRTQWVDASGTPDTAWTSHGRQGSSCPSDLSLTTQSAVGFSPSSATTVPTGVPFTLGQMTHSNNPIQGDNFFDGTLGIRFFGATQNFPWQLWETPNNASPCAIPGTFQPCDDQITFSDTTGNQILNIGGVDYQLVLLGFNNVGTGDIGDPPPTCPAYNASQVVDSFITEESTTNYGCLYAILDEPGSIAVTKTASPTSVVEPGGPVDFTVDVDNTSDDDVVTITSLTDDIYGNITQVQGDISATDCSVPVNIAVGSSYTCSFTGVVSGNAGSSHTNVVTASGTDDEGNPVSDDDDATVTVSDVAPSIAVTKTADPVTVAEPGANVDFTFVVQNTSATEAVEITSLSDSVYGVLAGDGDCAVGTSLAAGASCEFGITELVSGNAGSSHTNVFTAFAEDDEGNEVSDDDDATVTVSDVAPSIAVTKTADPVTVAEPGANVTFTFVVQNTSATEAVEITSLSDSVYGVLAGDGDCAVGTSLAAGASCEFEITELVSGNAGSSHTNVFTAFAEDDEGNEVSDDDDATVTVSDVAPSIAVTKTADPVTVAEPGANVTFTFVVQNTSATEAVEITSLSDSVYGVLAGDGDCAVGTSLAAGASCEFEITELVSGNAGSSHTNVFTAFAEDDEGNEVSDDDDATVTVSDVAPSIAVTKTADPVTVAEPGANVTFTFVVQNTSATEAVEITSLSDSVYGVLAGDGDCAVGTSLAAGASCEFEITELVSGNAGSSHTNVFTAFAEDDEGNEVSDDDDATVTVSDVAPSIAVTKTADPVTVAEPGANVTFTFVVQNTSATEAVEITSLSDSVYGVLAGDGDCAVGTSLAAGASCEFGITELVSGNAGSSHTNVFTAFAEDDEGNEVSDDDDATVTVSDVAPSIAVTKTADPVTVAEPGANVTFTFVVQNTSATEAVEITSLSDSVYGVLAGDGDCAVGTSLAAGASCEFGITELVSGNAGSSHTNVFTAFAEDDEGNEVSDDDDATVTVSDVAPSIAVTKTADPVTVAEPGANVTFTFVVQNTSATEAVEITSLSDSVYGVLAGDGDCAVGTSLAAGASCEFEITELVSGNAGSSHTNVFTAFAEDDEGNEVSDDDDATVTVSDVAPSIAVTKTADPVTVAEPGANVTFTFVVQNTSATEAVEITSLSDSVYGVLAGDGDCAVGTSLAAGASCEFEITELVSGNAGSSHTNVFTAFAEDDEGNEVSDDDDATVTVSDVPPTVSLDKSVDDPSKPEPGGTFTFTLTIQNLSVEPVTITALTDTQSAEAVDFSACTALIGTVLAADDGLDGGPDETSCTYQVIHTDAGTYPNVAVVTVVDDEQNQATDEDDESVEVTDEPITVSINKTVDVQTLPEPGGTFTFTLVINNDSVEPVTITALTDDNSAISSDFAPNCGPLVGQTLAADDLPEPGGADELSCTYTVEHADAGTYPNTAVVTVVDNEQNEATDEDDESVDVTDVLPLVELEKTVDVASLPEPGGTFTFTLIIDNDSAEPVTITALTDTQSGEAIDFGGCTALIGTVLAPDNDVDGGPDEVSCTYQVEHTDGGTYPNTAVVTVADNEQNEATDEDDESVEVTDVLPVIELVKSVDVSVLPEPGGIFTFTLTIQNLSVEPVTITALTDTQSGEAIDFSDCTALIGTVLAADDGLDGGPDETSCTYQVEHTDAGTYPNVAVVTVADDEQNEGTDEDDETVIVLVVDLQIVKTADVDFYNAVGDEIVYTVIATNTGEAELTNVDITDSLIAGIPDWTCDPTVPVASLAAGAAIECSGTYTIDAADIDAGAVTNAACVDADQTDEICDEVETPLAELEIVKTADVDFYNAVGDEIVYTVIATNTGEAELTNVDITDSLIAGIPDWTCDPTVPVASLAAGAAIECSGTYTIDAADIDAGAVTNAACVDADQTDEICDEVETPLAELEIVKEASHRTYSEVGDEIVYTITATNTGEADLENVDISDALIDGLASWTCDPSNPVALLLPGASIVCEATYVVTAADIEAGEVLNTACVDSDQTPEVCDEVVVDVIGIDLTKTPSTDFVDESGDAVTFTLEYSHPIEAPPIYLYSLEDDIFGDLLDAANSAISDNTCLGNEGLELLPDTTYTCSWTGPVQATVADPHVNVATITVTDTEPGGQPDGTAPRFATASDDAVVGLIEEETTPLPSPSPSPTLKPTDMLPATDSFGSGDEGDPVGGLLNWAIWLALSALLIVGTALLIRREKLAAVKNR